jgi:Glycosyl transferase family 2
MNNCQRGQAEMHQHQTSKATDSAVENLSSGKEPRMSVILPTPDTYETIRKTVGYLKCQTVSDQLELVIVAPSVDLFYPEMDDLHNFAGVQMIPIGKMHSAAAARAIGVRRARAPIVVFAEDHSFPEPGWAEALIKAYSSGSWVAVGPVIKNANPGIVSWSNLFLGYGPWVDPAVAGPQLHLPGHNSSYLKSVLLEYGERLENLLETESVLHWDLGAKGHLMYLEPQAKTRHLNITRMSSFVSEHYHYGRLFAAHLSRNWSITRRIVAALTAPISTTKRLPSILREFLKPGRPRGLVWRACPFVVTALLIRGAAEFSGYLFDAGDAPKRLRDLEFHRDAHISAGNRRHERSPRTGTRT